MSAKTKPIPIVVLYEDEVEFSVAAMNAMKACRAALHGAEDDEVVVLLGRKPDMFGVHR